MNKVTAADILKIVPITRKTLWIWQEKYKFIPNPTKKVHPDGKGIIGYYPTWVRSRCMQIYGLQKKGYTVPMIKETLEKEFREKTSKKILIIDDKKKTIDLMVNFFTKNNFIVEVAYDGLEAGLKVSEFSPSIIILDLGLLGLNGIKVCKLLKSNPKTKHIHIIAISGNLSYTEYTVLDAGAIMFFKKPIDLTQILEECSNLIESSEFEELFPPITP